MTRKQMRAELQELLVAMQQKQLAVLSEPDVQPILPFHFRPLPRPTLPASLSSHVRILWSGVERPGSSSPCQRRPASAFLNHWTCGTLSMQGGQIAEWVPIISSAVGVHVELLDQAPQLTQVSRDVFRRDHMDFGTAPTPPGVPRSSRPPPCDLLPRLAAQVSASPTHPKEHGSPDDPTARGGTERRIENILLRRPRRSRRSRGGGHNQAYSDGYSMEALRTLNVCWRSELERPHSRDQASPKTDSINTANSPVPSGHMGTTTPRLLVLLWDPFPHGL